MIIHHDINHIIRKINNFLNIVWSIGWQKAEINISFVVPSIQNKHYISDFSPPLYIHLFFLPAAEDQAVLAENAHYVETVLAILRFNACRQTQAASNTKAYLAVSKNSSFSRWTSWNHKASNDLQSMLIPDEGTPQRMLKSILLGAPSSSHRSYRGDAVQSPEPRDDGEGTSRSRRGPVLVQAELSASHVLKERRRREKLNERFVMLRSLVPFVTKVRI